MCPPNKCNRDKIFQEMLSPGPSIKFLWIKKMVYMYVNFNITYCYLRSLCFGVFLVAAELYGTDFSVGSLVSDVEV